MRKRIKHQQSEVEADVTHRDKKEEEGDEMFMELLITDLKKERTTMPLYSFYREMVNKSGLNKIKENN